MLYHTRDRAGLRDFVVLSHTFDLQTLTSAMIDQQVPIDRSNNRAVTFYLYLLEMKVVTGLVNVTISFKRVYLHFRNAMRTTPGSHVLACLSAGGDVRLQRWILIDSAAERHFVL